MLRQKKKKKKSQFRATSSQDVAKKLKLSAISYL